MTSQEVSVQMAPDLLSRLPNVPLDIILQHLDLASFTNLRLTSRQLSTNTISYRFFRSAKTDLSLDSLQSLQDRITHPQLGPLLRELTVVATLYDPQPAQTTVQTRKKWPEVDKYNLRHRMGYDEFPERNVPCTEEELQEARQDLAWIQTRMHLDTNTDVYQVIDLLSAVLETATSLRAINLDACIIAGRTKICRPAEHFEWYPYQYRAPTWPSMWEAASQTFRIVTSAISSSRIELERFQVFPNTPLCSVQLRLIEDHLRLVDLDGFAAACKSIRSLGLSLSPYTRIKRAPPVQGWRLFRDPFTAQSQPSPPQHIGSAMESYTGVATFLTYTPSLTSFDLHLHCLEKHSFLDYTKVFAHVSQHIRLGHLKQFSLRGFPLRPDDLVLFLTNHPTITKLSLVGIQLASGSWSSVFTCIEAMPALESLHLSSLSTQHRSVITNLDSAKRPVELSPQNREQWVVSGDKYILHTLSMCRDEIQQGLDFKPTPAPVDDRGKDMSAYLDRLAYDFGPPSRRWFWKLLCHWGFLTETWNLNSH